MTTISPRYGGSVQVEEIREGWRLTCCDDDGEIAVVYLDPTDGRRLATASSLTPAREDGEGMH
jgi:hypothetical protein